MPETIKQELIRRLKLENIPDLDRRMAVPAHRDELLKTLTEPERLHLFSRMAMDILRRPE